MLSSFRQECRPTLKKIRGYRVKDHNLTGLFLGLLALIGFQVSQFLGSSSGHNNGFQKNLLGSILCQYVMIPERSESLNPTGHRLAILFSFNTSGKQIGHLATSLPTLILDFILT